MSTMIFEKWQQATQQSLADDFSPFPRYADRVAWQNLPQITKDYYLESAKSILGDTQAGSFAWESLPAVRYMDFAKNGNRDKYQDLVFGRRQTLLKLAIAECIIGGGEYLDDIINGIWLICEETSWVIPAHNHRRGGTIPELPDIEQPIYIDLFSAETGACLTWIYYFLGEEIAKQAPLVTRRIELEVKRRILDPYAHRMDFDGNGWLGLTHNRPVNNWNPWINSNVLLMFLILGDESNRVAGVEKSIKSTDRFLASYKADGGCDEGPNYFGVAAASLFDFLEELDIATNSAINIHDTPLIKNMASYIYRVYIDKQYYVNFADAHAKVNVPAALLYRTGKKTNDETLVKFAEYVMKNNLTERRYEQEYWCLFRTFANIFQKYEDDKTASLPSLPTLPALPNFFYFEGIQVLTARNANGLFFAAKAGHNDESHNHNDIGNFIVYSGGEPIIIDAGVETYTKKTFSAKRYEIWTMQSSYHNTPTINGYEQISGLEQAATAVNCTHEDGTTLFSMDISAAYPKKAAVNSYKRQFTFADSGLTVKDSYSLATCENPLVFNLLLFNKPTVEKNRLIVDGVAISCNIDVDIEIEEITMTDYRIISDWGKNTLFRAISTAKNTATEGDFTLSVNKQ
ncbi:MAG: heparinase II/III-family protein [Defluviitaleaceae bacterium]|nr:heparinase II/III-family protein [Defluviitaleaceae bacterium]